MLGSNNRLITELNTYLISLYIFFLNLFRQFCFTFSPVMGLVIYFRLSLVYKYLFLYSCLQYNSQALLKYGN